MDKRIQPLWNPPKQNPDIALPNLYLFNSLSSKKDRFIPQNGTKVKWYTCGPTVYDASHMGHARTYISFDILRRIFVDYFNFDVTFVLNITDIDDKIIKRARQRYLLSAYIQEDHDLATVVTDISRGIQMLKAKSLTDPDPDKKAYLQSESERLIALLSQSDSRKMDPVKFLIDNACDCIADVLDNAYGGSVTDHNIFGALAKQYEKDYHDDMKALNVLPPDKVVRVTDYIQPIIQFVQKIIENGFGYVSPSGSVYFDTNRFASDPTHFYAKLVPTAYGDTDQLAIGEGELASTGEKRSVNDFALWKNSKPGEPYWPSPWGNGRPGWHIECSVMASSILGDSLDIHSGGVDLRFPHHDNELAQSEAYFGHSHWVHYFLHSGHLTISGCKMSKSLKNFITIRDALKQHSARRVRFTFLMHSWRETMDYNADTLAEAISYEKQVIDFLYNCSSLQLLAWKNQLIDEPIRRLPEDQTLLPALSKTQQLVYDALCDSCDTRSALDAIKELMTQADLRIFTTIGSGASLSEMADQAYLTARFVLQFLRVVGIADRTVASEGSPVPLGASVAGKKITDADSFVYLNREYSTRSWLSMDALTEERLKLAVQASLNAASTFVQILLREDQVCKNLAQWMIVEVQSKANLNLLHLPTDAHECLESLVKTRSNETLSNLTNVKDGLETKVWPIVLDFLFSVVSFRQSLRRFLSTGEIKDPQAKKRLYDASDSFRDQDLAVGGVRLQDRASVTEMSKGLDSIPCLGLVDPCILQEEMKRKLDREAQRSKTKLSQEPSHEKYDCKPPSQMFLGQLEKFSKFDDKGMPTHDATGKELSKNTLKKLKKLYDAQAKRYAASLNQKR